MRTCGTGTSGGVVNGVTGIHYWACRVGCRGFSLIWNGFEGRPAESWNGGGDRGLWGSSRRTEVERDVQVNWKLLGAMIIIFGQIRRHAKKRKKRKEKKRQLKYPMGITAKEKFGLSSLSHFASTQTAISKFVQPPSLTVEAAGK
jgi:hypothetical protein